ncbi:MAG TPA: SprT family zinc-dependent metalloprotease [Solirubrobacteraceae bacterium]|nr:SprT family zinc-dependent metalloprotease [Solirubrobacteraceae bacterium]
MTEVPYRIRRSDRARRVRVSVDALEGVEVVLPRRGTERDAREAMRELGPWVARRLAEIERARRELGRRPGFVPYLDGELRLVPEAGRVRAHRRGDDLLVPGTGGAAAPGAGSPGAAAPAGVSPDWREAAERWFRRAARAEISPRLDRACAEVGLEWGPLSIRGQRTRWASCSTTGAMSFNWRLLLAPEGVLDAVVWHEVCHLEVADHSPRFWSLLGRRCPDHREHQRWLRRYGPALVL